MSNSDLEIDDPRVELLAELEIGYRLVETPLCQPQHLGPYANATCVQALNGHLIPCSSSIEYKSLGICSVYLFQSLPKLLFSERLEDSVQH